MRHADRLVGGGVGRHVVDLAIQRCPVVAQRFYGYAEAVGRIGRREAFGGGGRCHVGDVVIRRLIPVHDATTPVGVIVTHPGVGPALGSAFLAVAIAATAAIVTAEAVAGRAAPLGNLDGLVLVFNGGVAAVVIAVTMSAVAIIAGIYAGADIALVSAT